MKKGLLISAVLALAFVALVVLIARGTADRPTKRTSAENLKKIALPPGLPIMFTSSQADKDAGEAYLHAISFYDKNRSVFNQGTPPVVLVDQLVQRLIDAKEAGRVPMGFLDQDIPMQPVARPDFDDALEIISPPPWTLPVVALERADQLMELGRTDRAFLIAQSVWALGQRLFGRNVRLINRLAGLDIMTTASQTMTSMTVMMAEGDKKLAAWDEAIDQVHAQWEPKIDVVRGVTPHIGDLIKLSQSDKDLTFRVAATLHLGVVKFNPRSRGNVRAIRKRIQAAMQSDQPMVARAATVAEGFTRDQLR